MARYCEDGQVPIDNNWVENQIGPLGAGTFQLAACRS
ncbi:MAG: transposase [Candidatus Thiodiazotropha sp.]